MTSRYILAPQAAQDLIKMELHQRSKQPDDGGPSGIGDSSADCFLSQHPGAGHWRKDLTRHNVKFFSVYSYLIVYRPETKPLQIVSILHGRRDVERLLFDRI